MNPQFQIDPRQVVANLKAQLVSQEKLLEVHKQSRHNLRQAVEMCIAAEGRANKVNITEPKYLILQFIAQAQLVQFEYNVQRLEGDIENLKKQIQQLDSPISLPMGRA